MKHGVLKPSHEMHRPGCLSGHESRYIEGNTCSYRWYAARRARADERIRYAGTDGVANKWWTRAKDRQARLEDWERHGKIRDLNVGSTRLSFKHDSFTTGWWPWDNHVHHIIPHSSLIQLLDEIALKAEPREQRAFNVMVNGLLGEPYNINDEPNVMILPIRDDDAVAMGLPRHLLGTGRRTADHPDYSREVKRELGKRISPRYRALITAIKTKKHPRRAKPPVLRPVLEALSIETYEEILSKTEARRNAGATNLCLDSIAFILYR